MRTKKRAVQLELLSEPDLTLYADRVPDVRRVSDEARALAEWEENERAREGVDGKARRCRWGCGGERGRRHEQERDQHLARARRVCRADETLARSTSAPVVLPHVTRRG